MLGFAGTSYALFAAVWSMMCLLSGALVVDTLLRDAPPAVDPERASEAGLLEL